ncbi:MAG: hypothetical protein QNJ16_01980, partial [Rhodobacter sp.]|nr:hypothetical protein [Rhodobacter sp.]
MRTMVATSCSLRRFARQLGSLSRANLLNEQEVATIVRKNGYRLWGNRSLASDPLWAFLSV